MGQAGLTTGFPSTQVTDYRSGILASRCSLMQITAVILGNSNALDSGIAV
jgi:hypothetical protein